MMIPAVLDLGRLERIILLKSLGASKKALPSLLIILPIVKRIVIILVIITDYVLLKIFRPQEVQIESLKEANHKVVSLGRHIRFYQRQME